MTESCKSCRFFNVQPPREHGFCRAHPRAYEKHTTDWCGEYEAPKRPFKDAPEAYKKYVMEQFEPEMTPSDLNKELNRIRREHGQPQMPDLGQFIKDSDLRHMLLEEDESLWACNRCDWSWEIEGEDSPKRVFDAHDCGAYEERP